MKISNLPKVPDSVSLPFEKICSFMEALCKEKLTEEYFDLSVKLAAKIARKRPSPFLSGSEKTWAAAIMYALGSVNFLFDKSQSPHLTASDLCLWFDLSKSTVSAKSKVIRDMFRMHQMDPHWVLPSQVIHNPLVWMVAFNGYIVDVREASYEMQVAALEAGVIPFIPPKKQA